MCLTSKTLKWIVIVVAFASLSSPLTAEEYRIGSEDILQVTFWRNEDLNARVRVGQDGKITIDIVGQIDAAGKTTHELEQEILRKMSRFNQKITGTVVRVIEFRHNSVYVTGQVNNGGKLTFEVIPNLWIIINEAGGLTEFADLSRVSIIRGNEEGGVEVVNVAHALATGQLSKLPKIERQDTIEIPGNPGNVSSGSRVATGDIKNLIYVVGAVGKPGPMVFEPNIDLLSALALAGGTSADADLKHARIITRDGLYAQTMTIDLEKYSQTGRPARYVLRREDTFIIPRRSTGGFLGNSLSSLGIIFGTISSAALALSVIR